MAPAYIRGHSDQSHTIRIQTLLRQIKLEGIIHRVQAAIGSANSSDVRLLRVKSCPIQQSRVSPHYIPIQSPDPEDDRISNSAAKEIFGRDVESKKERNIYSQSSWRAAYAIRISEKENTLWSGAYSSNWPTSRLQTHAPPFMFSRVLKATKSFFGPEDNDAEGNSSNSTTSQILPTATDADADADADLDSPPSSNTRNSQSKSKKNTKSSPDKVKMVTTRRQSKRASLAGEGEESVLSDSGSGNNGNGNGNGNENALGEVEVALRPSKRRRTSPKEDAKVATENEEPVMEEGAEEPTQDDEKGQVEEQPTKPAPKSKSKGKSKAQKEEAPAPPAAAPAKAAHKRFDSEEPEDEAAVVESVPQTSAAAAAESDSDSDDDDDDAPETVQNAAQLQSLQDAKRQQEEAVQR